MVLEVVTRTAGRSIHSYNRSALVPPQKSGRTTPTVRYAPQIDIAPDELWIRALQLDQLLLADTSEEPSVENDHHRILTFQERVERNTIP